MSKVTFLSIIDSLFLKNINNEYYIPKLKYDYFLNFQYIPFLSFSQLVKAGFLRGFFFKILIVWLFYFIICLHIHIHSKVIMIYIHTKWSINFRNKYNDIFTIMDPFNTLY
ncbi:hypothetical protein KUTeg_023951 [Tegillarca granosa]|uniref:Uncharacterized protein n=1 Tax=Tegillarca granosa TaxID=220873 RepID=A0ABQ9E1M1_TEGGR|nr:hypothetical protein KUTeg_023951 [Tegillarca granosa]